MAFWPFKRRRNHAAKGKPPSLSEKANSLRPSRSATAPQSLVAAKGGRFSRRGSRRNKQRASEPPGKVAGARYVEDKRPGTAGTSGPVARKSSIEDITALPGKRTLPSSPHLRALDAVKPQIPYNFRPDSSSQTSLARQKFSQPPTIRSKRSKIESAPSRKTSTRSKARDESVREEQIRAMSANIPIPPIPGSGPLRQDSRKARGRGSNVSLPPDGSIHSAMSGVIEQRGWEVGGLAIFNPRPSVRLSGSPQYVSPGLHPTSSGILYRIDSIGAKNKAPVSQDSERKRRTVGNEANDLGASDLRAILERDAKRRVKKDQERQEKLDQKLRNRADRDRIEAEKKEQKEMGDELRAEIAKARAEDDQRARELMAPPTAVHPAFRNQSARTSIETTGLGADEIERSMGGALPAPQNPFTDAAAQYVASPRSERHFVTPLETPMEEPTVEMAQAVRISTAQTPPLSPVRGPRSGLATLNVQRQESIPDLSALPQHLGQSEDLPSPVSPTERRPGAWATFFRRGNTTARKSFSAASAAKAPQAEMSFSNTSRESMRKQSLPPHLIDTNVRRPSATGSASGTPTRTQSKFREDLPELPISPPDSRTPTPDVTTMAAAVAAARRRKRGQKTDKSAPVSDLDAEAVAAGRSDTPVSPANRRRGMVSPSMASVDSEGSWLAGGPNSHKRTSNQSALSRSLSQRRQEFNGSYEELGGGDKDAEYMRSSTGIQHSRKLSSPAMGGAAPDEEGEIDMTDAGIESSDRPLTVHESVRKKPTLVHRNPLVKSREGLLAEFESGEPVETPFGTPGRESPPDTEDGSGEGDDLAALQLQQARSVQTHGSRHSRQFSAGSARLLDMKKTGAETPPPGTAGSKSS